MQEYKIVNFEKTNLQNEILIALLSQLEFDSFEELNDNSLTAYILKENYSENEIKELLQEIPVFNNITFTVQDLENKNWNEEWEKNFKPIKIGNDCVVRAPFHLETDAKYELLIEPKMAFGTGHHATTEMMLTLMLDIDFDKKDVLDFGAGTGILSFLASKKGAKEVIANDIEEAAFENLKENATLNNCTNIVPLLGDIKVLPIDRKYNVILANVTANIISKNFAKLTSLLLNEGNILFSGILKDQSEEIEKLAQNLNLIKKIEQNNWVALHYKN